MWSDPRATAWTPQPNYSAEEEIEPELLEQITAAIRTTAIVYTLGPSPKPNYSVQVTSLGIWVETDRSRARHEGAQLVPPRILNLAWDALRANRRLSNSELLNEMRVHRSSFVCALLSRLPAVTLESTSPIVLRYSPP